MATILDLPLALLLDIGEWFDDRRSLNALARTSRYFYTALNVHLYKLHIRHDPPSESCLFWAAEVGQLGTFKMAHQLGANVNVQRETQKEPPSPLHAAIRNLHPDIVEYILENGGAVHSPPWVGMGRPYPLGKVLTARNLKQGASGVKKNQIIVDILIRHGATLVDEDEPALPRAAALNKRRVVHLLLQQPTVSVNHATRRGWSALHMVCQNGHAELLRYLLNQPGIDIHARSVDGSNALGLAIANGHLDLVRQLVMWHGLTSDTAFELRKEALAHALEAGQTSICEFLITLPGINGLLLFLRNCTPLHWAAQSENVDSIPVLLDKSTVDLAAVDDDGQTVLHCLAMTGNSKGRMKRAHVAKMLVERGAEINKMDLSGHTPLQLAIARNNFDVATQLLHSGADPTIGTESDSGDYVWTLLHESLLENSWIPWNYEPRTNMLRTIVQYDPASLHKESRVTDADMRRTKAVPFDGTPLLFAVLYDGEPGTIQMLMDRGARMDSVAIKRGIEAPNSFHSIIQALVSLHLPPEYPASQEDDDVGVGEEHVSYIKGRLEILLSGGARIDDKHGSQSVLEYACELHLAGCPGLLGTLFEMARLENVSLGHVEDLIHKYSDVVAEENAMTLELAYKLQKWMHEYLIPEEKGLLMS